MRVVATEIPEVLVIEPRVFRDDRGFFLETYHRDKLAASGLDVGFVQDNHSRSAPRVLRGLHAQRRRPQGKLVRATEGAVWDVAVDIRPGSPTYRRWVGRVLSAENFLQLWVPPGFAHGFCVLGDAAAQLQYKCTDFYDPEDEIGIRWDDPELAIDWPIAEPVLSAKDAAAPTLAELEPSLPRASGSAPAPPPPGARTPTR
ncbi:MAG TPA: dTDP-4-dehydrorhamnose 3,5-epimerase [Thermoanaerobaculia bacterium]|nr:dTDP-4-dehydrorhamnose 3,5-epimerase [Thermoanaerobaculia bacterium]